MCEYCIGKINNKKIEDIDNDKADWMEVIFQEVHGSMIYVELNGEDSDGYKTVDFFSIYYCPKCRKKVIRKHEKER